METVKRTEMSEEEYLNLRKTRRSQELDAEKLNRIVDQIVEPYEKELDTFLQKTRDKLNNNEHLSDDEIEQLTLTVPIFLYFANEGLSNIGIAHDNSKITKKDMHSRLYERSGKGTIPEKQARVQIELLPETYMEEIYKRAHTRLANKIDACNNLCLATRKVMDKRVQEMFNVTQDQEGELK